MSIYHCADLPAACDSSFFFSVLLSLIFTCFYFHCLLKALTAFSKNMFTFHVSFEAGCFFLDINLFLLRKISHISRLALPGTGAREGLAIVRGRGAGRRGRPAVFCSTPLRAGNETDRVAPLRRDRWPARHGGRGGGGRAYEGGAGS